MKSVIACFSVFLLFASCSIQNQTFSDPKHWIPEDFSLDGSVLLVENYPISAKSNDKMKAFLAEKYPGKYEIVELRAIMNKTGKYSDTQKYRYALLWKLSYNYKRGITSGFEYRNVDPNGHFYDRNNSKEYPTTKKYNNYGQMSYVPFINTIVKHARK